MEDPPSSIVDFSIATDYLARRLSSLRRFLVGAAELLTCENLSSGEIRRHQRKIVTLLEIARGTLRNAGVRLYKFTSCAPVFLPYKKAYFDLLRVLKQIRPSLEDPSLQDRINRLLLPLSTWLRTPASDEFAEFFSTSSSSPQAPSSSRLFLSGSPCAPADGQPSVEEDMPPPDILLTGPHMRRSRSKSTLDVEVDARPRGRSSRRPIIQPQSPSSSDDELESEDDEPLPVLIHRPRPRFGILCTNKQPVFHRISFVPTSSMCFSGIHTDAGIDGRTCVF